MDMKTKIRLAMEKIIATQGGIQASELVEAARPEDSPIHDAFTWDDQKAAEEYRLVQARHWIRRVKVVYEGVTQQVINVPVFIHDDTSAENIYRPIYSVVKNPNEYWLCLERAKARLAEAERAIQDLREASRSLKRRPNLDGIFGSICAARVGLENIA